jgi:cytochrome c oxidase cbb3-type subunit 1
MADAVGVKQEERELALEDELVNKSLVKKWLLWGFIWVLVAPTVGVIVSTKFNYPEFLGDSPYFTFGRLRPIHVNGVILGVFSTLFIGMCYYVVPRLTGTRVYLADKLGNITLWIWNLTLAGGFISLAFGANQGIEAGELPLITDIILEICFLVLTLQFFVTIAKRREEKLYVSLWYLIAAFVWTDINWAFGNFIIPYSVPGINNAALHGLFIHYVVGLWITPAGYVMIYYFLPASVRNPIYSHKLSLIGFWSLAFFYPFVGIHHYLYSPIADWAETLAIVSSMMLIIPVWTVIQNFFGTMIGRWSQFHENYTAKFLILGSIMYLFGCFQGSTEALRSLQQPTHFTDFVISHSHLTVFGTFVLWVLGPAIFVWQRITGQELWSSRMANWSFWLITAGISSMGIGLTFGGLQQGYMWMKQVEWVESVIATKPFWLFRTFSGIAMDIGMTLLVINLLLTTKARARTEMLGSTVPSM